MFNINLISMKIFIKKFIKTIFTRAVYIIFILYLNVTNFFRKSIKLYDINYNDYHQSINHINALNVYFVVRPQKHVHFIIEF